MLRYVVLLLLLAGCMDKPQITYDDVEVVQPEDNRIEEFNRYADTYDQDVEEMNLLLQKINEETEIAVKRVLFEQYKTLHKQKVANLNSFILFISEGRLSSTEDWKNSIIATNQTYTTNIQILAEYLKDPFLGRGFHWTHMPITFGITNEEECGSYESRRIRRAFDQISNITNGIVSFEEVTGIPDITLKCSFIKDCYEKHVDVRKEEGLVYKWETICEHKKGTAQITEYQGDKILKGEIEFIGLYGFAETTGRDMSGFYIGSCGHLTTELHEILHVFGFDHVDDNRSVMYYGEDFIGHTIQKPNACVGKRKEIDQQIVEGLIETYS